MTVRKTTKTDQTGAVEEVKTASVIDPAAEAPQETVETVMYIGDSIPSLGLQKNALFRNGVPETLKPHTEKCPAIGALMVPVSKLSAASSKLTVKGTAEYTLNQQALSYGRGEK